MKNKFSFFALIITVFFAALTEAAALGKETARRAATSAQWAEGASLHDYSLTDQDGRRFNLSEYFNGKKPLLVSFIYTTCGSTCPESTASLLDSVKEARKEFGEGFKVLTIGFNEEETPATLRDYGKRFRGGLDEMRFATADKDTLERLTKEFGFFFKKKEDGHGFDHLNMVSVVSPEGRLYRQVYGTNIKPEDIKKPLREIYSGNIPVEKPPTLIDSIKMFCTVEDPLTRKLSANYPVIISITLQAGLIMTILYFIAMKPLYLALRHRPAGPHHPLPVDYRKAS